MNQTSDFQRVLVVQWGGALGAFEAGVYKGLYESITEYDKKNGLVNKH